MILDLLSNSPAYESLHPLFPQAFAYLRSFDPATPDGKYELLGPDLVANVQHYVTAPSADKKWEAHERFGDIQVLIRGEERCGHADRRLLRTTQPYLAEKDVEKFGAPDFPATSLVLRPGLFSIFYPQDAHQPGVRLDEACEVLKVVIKFRLR